jgi:thioredoxin reductase (NADPH)
LAIDRLAEFEGAGVYYAATENEARFCKDWTSLSLGAAIRRVRPPCF